MRFSSEVKVHFLPLFFILNTQLKMSYGDYDRMPNKYVPGVWRWIHDIHIEKEREQKQRV